ncbi:ABC transporter ATP-binding protein [Roseofilum casamattae]|uniref:Spermidine/putrescine import ATP-binding protein PotA n=1 Tax=Roseofilum casamattae BLCC-M143 TaxID=3022442 RepID=A0ABT7BWQ8_9CYAN|nr:ABC transporter ATP-binding protein [Roseofilum casamattae]MDJ1183247.1 ABC transporter ATP-binding protein [Roseofilum casamattae BLCC-M143]
MSQTATNPVTREANSELDVELRKVFKVFGSETAVRGVNLAIRQGEFFSILGPSGCGKTTTLRLIAGFETPSAGDLLLQGQSVNSVPPYRRPVNTVFQSYALFGHMNVSENIAFGLRLKKLTRSQIEDRVQEALRLVKMEAFASRLPKQMSGGQQQRVALARALVNRPAVLLLDEPLGALDLKLRKEMQVELSNLHQELGLTFVMVTHDQEEALSLSERIAIMRDGKIEQVGSPSEIYNRPISPFVADFIGDTNLFRGRRVQSHSGAVEVKTENGLNMWAALSEQGTSAGDRLVVSVRPEKIHLTATPPESDRNCFPGMLKHSMFMGTHIQCVVELRSGDLLTVAQPARNGSGDSEVFANGEGPLYVHWQMADCLALAE